MSNLSSTSAPWAQIASMWKDCFTPPSRISAQERECYRQWAREKASGGGRRALVLGVTPEIREELFALGYRVTCVDMNLDMILAMNELLLEKPADEILVRGNWLDVPLADGFFDLAVGDAVLPNIPWEERPKLLSHVRRFLKPGGVFLTRAFCAPTDRRFSSVAEVLKDIENRTGISLMQRSLEFVLELQYLTRDPANRIASFKKAKETLDLYLRDNPEARRRKAAALIEHQYAFWFSRFLEKVFVYASVPAEEAEYQRHFSIRDRFEAADHRYGALTPMYLLGKQS